MTYSATAPVKLLAGTAGAPGVTFTTDTDTGLYRPGPNEIAVAVGGVEKARFTDSGMGIGGDITLDDGVAGFVTTLQTITATANRTISFPDATGTIALVAGSSGQLIWNLAGANAGVSGTSLDTNGNITLTANRLINNTAGSIFDATSTTTQNNTGSPFRVTGTWLTAGGTSTTTKPQVLVEPAGTTSTAWSTAGTGLGVNAASGFAGNLLDLQVNGTSQARFTKEGTLAFGASTLVQPSTAGVGNWVGTLALFGSGGALAATVSSLAVNLSGNYSFEWGSDVRLFRDAAGILAQRNAANAQTYRLYNTFTSDTNYERGKLEWASNVFRIGTEKGSAGGTARALELQTDGTTRATIDTSGRLLVGTSTSNGKYYNYTGQDHPVQVESTGYLFQSWTTHSTSAFAGVHLTLARSRGTSVGSYTAVQSGDILGHLSFQGADGSEFVEAARIETVVDGTPGPNDMPGRLVFSTTADGGSVPTERMRITSSGAVGIGTTSPTTGKLTLVSDIDPGTTAAGIAVSLVGLGAGTATSQYGIRVTGTGYTNSTNTYGVHSALTQQYVSPTYGGYFSATSYYTQGYGVYAETTCTNPVTAGASYAGYFKANSSAAGTNYTNVGVQIENAATTGSLSRGLYVSTVSGPTTVIPFQVDHAGTERIRIDSSGRLLVGTSTARTNYFGNASIGSNFQVVGSTHAESSVIIHNQAANTQAPYLQLGKARGTGYEIVSSGDLLGSFVCFGADGSTMRPAASINAFVDGTPGPNDMPGRLVFSTTADGAASPTERVRITSAGQIQAGGLGTAAAPVLSFLSDPNTGIYSPGADQVAVATNGQGRLFVDASGNVGVGTSAPQNYGSGFATLEARGTTGTAGGILQSQSFDASVKGYFYVDSSTNTGRIGTATNHPFLIVTNTAERLRVTAAGLVGVGTSSPRVNVHILGTASNAPTLGVASGSLIVGPGDRDYGLAMGTAAAGYSWIQSQNFVSVGAAYNLLLQPSGGNVGIGTSAPGGRLELNTATVDNSTNYTETIWNPYAFRVNQGNVSIFSSGGASSAGDSHQLSFYGRYFNTGQSYQTNKGGYIRGGVVTGASLDGQARGEGILYIGTSTTNYGTLGVSDSDTVVVRNNRVGIGTTSPNYKLEVGGSLGNFGVADNGCELFFTRNANNNINANGASATLNYSAGAGHIYSVGGSERARIDSSGRLLVGTSTSRGNNFSSGSGQDFQFQIEGTDYLKSGASFTSNSASTTYGPHVVFNRSRGTVIGSNTVVQNGDNMGSIGFQGNDGSAFVQSATIQAFVDGTPGAGDMPGRLVFSTTADGSASPTERMRITSSGLVGIGTSTPGSKLTIDANFTGYNVPLDVRNSGSSHPFLGVAQTFSVNTGTVVEPVGRILATSSSWTYGTLGSNKFTIEGMKPGGIDIRSNIDAPITFSTGGTQDFSVERLRITSSGQIEAGSLGTAAAPVLSFLADPDTGLYSPGANQVAISTAGTQKFTIDSFDGNPIIETSYPLIRPTLDLNFAATRRLDPRVTFSRDSIGTFVGSDGLIQTAASGQARFDHDPTTGESLGLLVEEARTNSLWPSEPTTAASRNIAGSPGNTWAVYDGTVSSASRNAINGLEVTISPTLDNNGFTGGNTTNWGGIGGGGSQAGGSTASVSLFINPLTWTGNIWIGRLPQDGNTTFAAQTFQLFNNGIYTGPASNVKAIFPDGTYWLHNIAWTGLSTNTAAGQFLVLFTTTPGDNIKKFWAGGFQWEAGAFSTSYIPTTGATVTRAGDVASITGANFSSFFVQNTGSLFVDCSLQSPASVGQAPIVVVDSAGANFRAFSRRTTTGARITSNTDLIDVTSGVWNGEPKKTAFTWVPNDCTLVDNGILVGTSTSASPLSTVDRMLIGTIASGGFPAVGVRMKRLVYWPTRLPNATLQAITQ